MTVLELPIQRKPQKQLPFHVFQLPISAILADPTRYIIPDMQRDEIWPELWKRVLIETIFEGHPIEALHFHKKFYDDGAIRYQVINGRQRLSTIRAFYADQFRTLTPSEAKKGDVGGQIPIEPGRVFSELTVASQHAFLNFELTIQCIDESASDHDLEIIFRRGNHYISKATTAENLASYHSRSIDHARMATHHPLWSEIYIGGKKRRQEVLGALYPLILERSGKVYVSLAPSVIDSHGRGSFDIEYTEEMYKKVLERLDMAYHLFYQSTFRTVQNIIPLYQLIILLEQSGDHPLNYERGCLTPWFTGLMHHKTGHGYGDRFKRMVNMNRQKEFWEDHHTQVRGILDKNRVVPYTPMSITG